MIFAQIFDIVNIGIVILDEKMNVYKWNRWMEIHGRIKGQDIVGKSIFVFFPHLENRAFLRNAKSVFEFGNFAFFSQKLHGHLFPFKPVSPFDSTFEYMQQSCTMGPLRDETSQIRYAFIMIQDVTDIAAYQQKLIEMNNRDGLTGVFNRRYLQSCLKDESQRYQRYLRPFCIIIQDIDYFKNVNDTFGHQAGDQVLKDFSQTVVSTIRNVDIFARYGGEEFCCLLPETKLSAAGKVAELIRHRIMNTIFSYNNIDIRITISQGVAEFGEKISCVDALLKEADDALYAAKKSGRNKVVSAHKG